MNQLRIKPAKALRITFLHNRILRLINLRAVSALKYMPVFVIKLKAFLKILKIALRIVLKGLLERNDHIHFTELLITSSLL